MDIKKLVLEAIKEALTSAERAQAKQRPISNIDAEAICSRFFRDKEDAMSSESNTNIFWVSAFIESKADLFESPEFDEFVRRVKEGDRSGVGQKLSGQLTFCVK